MESDMRYAVNLLQRINAIQREGKIISSFFYEGEYSLWSFQQYFIFSQIEEFSKTKDFVKYSNVRKFRYGIISKFLVMCFNALVVSFTVIEIIHTRFQKPNVATFSSDFLNADSHLNPRLRNIYSYLQDQNIPYAEILHITNIRNFFRNIIRRRRLSIYLEAFGTVARIRHIFKLKHGSKHFIAQLDLREFSDFERPFVEFLITEAVKKIRVSKTSIELYKTLFRYLGVRKYISVDDFRYIPELLFACEREQIPTHVFQHSNFGYITGLYLLPAKNYIFPTVFYTWNSYWFKRVKEISPFFSWHSTRVQIGGRSYTPAQPTHVIRTIEKGRKDTLSVLIPSEVSIRRHQIAPYIDLLFRDERIKVLFVLRGTVAQIDHEMQLSRYFTSEHRASSQLVIVEPAQREKAIRSCDVIAGVYSGFLDESIETGVPVCIFLTDFLNVNRLDTDNLASLIDSKRGNIYDQLLSAYQTPDHILVERRERVTAGAVDIKETLGRVLDGF